MSSLELRESPATRPKDRWTPSQRISREEGRTLKLLYALSLVGVLAAGETTALSQRASGSSDQFREAMERVDLSIRFLDRLLPAENGIPTTILGAAKAIAVFPSDGGPDSGGTFMARGVISRLVGIRRRWTVPAFYQLQGRSNSGTLGTKPGIVLIFLTDNIVDLLRIPGKVIEFRKDEVRIGAGPTKTSQEPTPPNGADVLYYGYTDSESVGSRLGIDFILPDAQNNSAIYSNLTPEDILFHSKKPTPERDLIMNTLPTRMFSDVLIAKMPRTVITPKQEEFFDAGYSYSAVKSFEFSRDHIRAFFNGRSISYIEDPSSGGTLITAFIDLTDFQRRYRRAAFLVEIRTSDNQQNKCLVSLKWLVNSKGLRENIYSTTPEDTRMNAVDPYIPDLRMSLKDFLAVIRSSIEELTH